MSEYKTVAGMVSSIASEEINRLESENERLRKERDIARHNLEAGRVTAQELIKSFAALESELADARAERDVYRKALEEIADLQPHDDECVVISRYALKHWKDASNE